MPGTYPIRVIVFSSGDTSKLMLLEIGAATAWVQFPGVGLHSFTEMKMNTVATGTRRTQND